MNNTTFSDSTRRYFLECGGEDMDLDVDADTDLFEITKINYRTLFDKSANQNISHTEMVFKVFGIENISDVDTVPQKYKYIEFESLSQAILEDKLAANLQCILKTDLFSNTFSEDQRKRVITNLLLVGFQSKYKLVTNIGYNAESTYKNSFMNFLFRPICEYVTSLLRFEPQVEEENAIGQTGVHTRIPHQSNDLFYSYPYMMVYAKNLHYQSLALVEVKKLPILNGKKILHFSDLKTKISQTNYCRNVFKSHKQGHIDRFIHNNFNRSGYQEKLGYDQREQGVSEQ